MSFPDFILVVRARDLATNTQFKCMTAYRYAKECYAFLYPKFCFSPTGFLASSVHLFLTTPTTIVTDDSQFQSTQSQ